MATRFASVGVAGIVAQTPPPKTKLTITNHTGYCCGIKQAFNFSNYHGPISDFEEKKAFVARSLQAVVDMYRPKINKPSCQCSGCMAAILRQAEAAGFKTVEEYLTDSNSPRVKENERQRKEWSTAVEVVLNENQIGNWREVVEACGFKQVFEFRNSNSRRMCYVFFGLTNPVELKDYDYEGEKNVESAPADTTLTAA